MHVETGIRIVDVCIRSVLEPIIERPIFAHFPFETYTAGEVKISAHVVLVKGVF